MAVDTVAAFFAEVRQSQLVEAAQLEELAKDAKSFSDPRVFAKHCIKKGWLTPFQVNQLLLGAGSSLVMGQYRIMERVGEGGMGQVFKARHQAMGRIVALKVIRKDRLENEKAVKRFRREIQVAAQLAHPNVVLAFDADAVGGTHFIAMEYVDGVDLARMVKEKGPMPVAQACEYIRQAALGLQHAHERGLVHRDIKPSNLLVARPAANGDPRSAANSGVLRRGNKPQIKILDMGLARLMFDSDEASTGMTQDGSVVGTPDFMSPEQGKNSHLVDHRADIYSLGCTLYFLLAGQVPYPGGSNIEKLVKHQMDYPRPVEEIRNDVPDSLRKLLRRMIAKKPDDRPQTGNEVASLLAPFCEAGGVKAAGRDSKKVPLPVAPIVAPTRRTAWSRVQRTAGSSFSVFRKLVGGERRPRRRSRGKLVLAGLALLLLLGGFFWVKSRLSSDDPVAGTTAFASTRTSPTTPGTTPVPLPPPINPKGSANAPYRYFPEATNLAIGFNVRDIKNATVYNSGYFQRDVQGYRPLLEQGLGLDLQVEVDHVVVCLLASNGGNTQQQALVYQGAFEANRFRTAMSQRGAQLRGNYYYLPDNQSFAAMVTPSIVVATDQEALMRSVSDRATGPVAPPLADPAIQRGFESWSWPGLRIIAGETYPIGASGAGQVGLRQLALDVSFAGDSATARLAAATGSAAHAATFQTRIPEWLHGLADQDNGYARLLKHLLESQPSVTADHSIIWQATLTRFDLGAYFIRMKSF